MKKSKSKRLLAALLCFVLLAIAGPITASEDVTESPAAILATDPDTIPYNPGRVRVGVKFGTTVMDKFSFEVKGGVRVGVNEKESSTFYEQITLPAGVYSASPTYGYWLRVNCFFDAENGIHSSEDDFEGLLQIISDAGYTAYPAYADGFCCCVPVFSDEESAWEAYAALEAYVSAMGGYAFLVADVMKCSSLAVKLADSHGDYCYFFDSSIGSYAMAVDPLLAENDSAPHTIIDGYTYQGYLEMRRDSSGKIQVVSVIPLEHYIACINAGEIYGSWLVEIHRAFAVTVRSYTIANLGKHEKQYGFDFCCNTCCQHYVGDHSVTAKIVEGVESTAGQVMLYNGTIAKVNYSAVSGGVTVKSADAWAGRDHVFLDASPTPWERFGQHCKPYSNANYTTRGKYSKAFTGEELYNKLKSSYSALKGPITDVTILAYAVNSSYVRTIRFTDCYGNSVDIDSSDKIRIALGLDSGNFIVGKAGETVTRTYYELDNFESVIYGNGLPEGAELPDVLNAQPVKKTIDVTLEGPEGSFVFDGAGWGHGVGLSQYGAWDMTTLGYDYRTVLAYYFHDTELVLLRQPQGDFLFGDINGDGTVSIFDVTELLIHIADPTLPYDLAVVDLSDDGTLSISDVTALLIILKR